jgi:hypothetical protein
MVAFPSNSNRSQDTQERHSKEPGLISEEAVWKAMRRKAGLWKSD